MADEPIGLIGRAGAHLSWRELPQHPKGFSDVDSVVQPIPAGIVENEDASPMNLVRTLRRRKYTLIASTLLFFGAAAFVIYSMVPIYVGEALVVVGNRGPGIDRIELRVDGNTAQMLADPATVQTEVDILRSPALALQVVEELKLAERPEFNPSLRQDRGVVQRIRGWVSVGLSRARELVQWSLDRPVGGDREAGGPDARATAESTAVEIFLSKLTVAAKNNSRVIAVRFEDPDPQLAAATANALLEHYIANQVTAKALAAQDTTRWLDRTVAELRQRVTRADQAYEQFRANFESRGGREFQDRRMTDASSQLATAELARRDAETRLARLKGLGGRSVTDVASTEVGTSPVMQSLRQRAAELEAQLGQLSANLGEGHPKIQAVKAGIGRLNREMRAEVARLTTSLEGEVRLATMKENSLRQNLAAARNEIAGSSDGQAKLSALKAEATSNRAVLEAFLTRLNEARGTADRSPQRIDAEIVSRANVPRAPEKPRISTLLAIVAVGSVMAGSGVALARERANRTFRSSQEIETETGTPTLALVPLTRNPKGPQDDVLALRDSFYGESIRALYRTLILQRRFKMLVVTSAHPNEGKTTIATSLALIAAQSGKNVLLVDADLRRSGASEMLGLAGQEGFAEVVSGKRTFSAVVAKAGPFSNFHVLASGARENAVTARSALEDATDLFRRLRDDYDLIVIDSPPVLALSDAMVLSAQADATLFAVRWATTSRTAAKLGLKQLRTCRSNGTMAGVVLSMVNAREHMSDGHPDSAFYSKELLGYHRTV